MRPGVWCVVFWLFLVGCRPVATDEARVRRAQFGILYGGEVQERRSIPFELDRRKLTLLLRIEFSNPLCRPVRVSWALDMPGYSRGVPDLQGRRGAGRLVRVDEAWVPAGRDRFDQVIALAPGDPLGLWRIRVEVDGKTVIERPFLLYDPARSDGGLEAVPTAHRFPHLPQQEPGFPWCRVIDGVPRAPGALTSYYIVP